MYAGECLFGVKTRGFGELAAGFVFRNEAAKGKKELGMDGYPRCIQGSYACGGYHNVIFMCLGGKLFQKGGFAGTGFPG